ncbi:DUF808 domain-containing protein [Pusillimonas noertemannii]|uniref:DUF808 domain-containing protein n=1 Tax=Pusillimonas noertemannii TaxID=305977 RepID=UPI00333ECAD2
MAGAGLLMLLDDITTILDDVAAMTKLAGRKTAGVLGDDIALNAEQVSGVAAKRELPVVWAVAKGSFLNKLILVPLALLISAVLPAAVTPLLMVGGLFLCYEGAEKIIHSFSRKAHKANRAHKPAAEGGHEAVADAEPQEAAQARQEMAAVTADLDAATLRTNEQVKIKGAIRTDFILSAEIVAITLGTVANAPFGTRALVVAVVAVLLTILVYGLVATVVKLDDVGAYLLRRKGQHTTARLARATGRGVLAFAPYLMRGLSIAGTAAMFLVGGGLLVHGIAPLEGWVHHAFHHAAGEHVSILEAVSSYLGPALISAATGIVAGFIVYGVLVALRRLRG